MATTAAAATKTSRVSFPDRTDKAGKTVRGEMRAGGEAPVNATLRRQGIKVLGQKLKMGGGGHHRQGHYVLRASNHDETGAPLLQSFDIVGKGHSNARVQRLPMTIKTDVESVRICGVRKAPTLF
jgi:type IV pilus assembly protein PilC